MAAEEHSYHAQDAIKASIKGAGVVGTSGLFAAAVQNALQKNNVGAMGVFTRSGGIIALFAIGGGAYSFTKTATANLRQKNDPWNSAVGGFIAGSIIGASRGRMPAVLGLGAMVSSTMGIFEFTGGRLRGWRDRPEEEEFDLKMAQRANRRRPIEETIAEIGEGRGIRPPGYEERRRERIKEKYGIEVNPVKVTVD